MFTIDKIVPVIVLLCILAFVIWRKLSSEKGKEEVKNFLNSMADRFEGVIIDNIDDIDFDNFNNLADIEKVILNQVYDQIWQIATSSLTSYVKDPIVKALITKYLTRETVEDFSRAIFQKDRIQTIYTAKYNQALISSSNLAAKVEEDTVKQNAEYASEKLEPDEIPNWAEHLLEEESKDVELRPAHGEDEEEVISESDNSVEEV